MKISVASAAVRYCNTLLGAAAVAAASLLFASAAGAANQPALRLIKTIPINGTAGNPTKQMFSFDISWVDQSNGLYYLADRSNASVDVVDTTGAFTGKPESLFGQIGLGFAGDTGKTSTSGPNGVVAAFPCIFVTDSISKVWSINAANSFTTPVALLNTGGQFRADELAYDPKDGIILAINNADTPSFGTLIPVVKSTCQLSTQTIKVTFNSAGGVNATNGAEQPVWDPTTQRFYLAIPEINGPGGGGPNGGVARINPISGVIETVYPVNFCQPAGLVVGSSGDLLVGCNTVFDTAGNACLAATAGGAPASCTGTANPQVAVCNPSGNCAGSSLVAVAGPGGGDEVAFNSGNNMYYITGGNNTFGPNLGVVASGASSTPNQFVQLMNTIQPIPAVTTGAIQHGAGSAHSVATSNANGHVYVPIPANTSYPNCAQGCIAVFSAQ